MPAEMPPRFAPGTIENKWYQFWQEHALFKAVRDIRKKPFTIMIPPPNVTGALHMGHALNNTLQDVVARFKRMQGFCVLWLPGTDHAGIATQAVVEKKLLKDEGKSRQELGREGFIAEIWKWKDEYGNRILNQLRQLGASCDWSRTRFTLDEGLSRAVRESFVKLWEKGLIYRGYRMINWDCKLETAISDDEIETSEVKSSLWYLRYPYKDNPEKYVVVATTRPETMFGDTAVAVNPNDERFKSDIGKTVVLPIAGREVPIIADDTVNPEFGTGAVKVTPGHDFADYERGQRHNLPMINVLNKDGTLNEQAGKYAGQDRLKARKSLVEELDALGLLERVEDYTHQVPHSDRSKTPVEPLLSDQWFVSMKPLARPAIEYVKPNAEGKREITFVPERWEKVYLNWLESVRDWCISRQLWWGHRIPVWYDADGNTVALREDPAPGAVHPTSGKPLVRQDDDVLDTWASSWLWPFSTLGWPEKTSDLDYFYPTHFLSTARDIIYLWVARMVMASHEFMGEKPFSTVYIHATVLDAQGRRMSKSLNNGIDPIDMFSQWGVDAVRLTLPLLTSEGQDIKLSESKFEMGRNFCNKLWNASRFVLTNLGDFEDQLKALSDNERAALAEGQVSELEDCFIEGKLTSAIVDVTDAIERYKFNDAAQAMYHFVWDEFCDWYLEAVKPRLYEGKGGERSRLRAQATLVRALDGILKLLHPYVPFITEEIWQNLRPLLAALRGATPELSLAIAAWPKASKDRVFEPEQRRFTFVQQVTRAFRNIRAEHAIDPKTAINGVLRAADKDAMDMLGSAERETICKLGGLSALKVEVGARKPKAAATAAIGGGNEAYVSLEGLIDFKMELLRLEASRAKLEDGVRKLKNKLENLSYLERAPRDVVQRDRDKLSDLIAELERIDKHIEEVKPLAK
ncbi:MAG: valine--tRNA ligase [Planctomycetes bacterium]|nr:valine--tRNA ligase [Planctomycetota bacterium]MCW8134496.1 valine--tRNA ligase [Planctomycetota bacterium]